MTITDSTSAILQEDDTVRVVMEGKVTRIDDIARTFHLADLNIIDPDWEHVVSVERVEPRVVLPTTPGAVVIGVNGSGPFMLANTGEWFSRWNQFYSPTILAQSLAASGGVRVLHDPPPPKES